jgi:hypothetical protein
LYGCDIKGRTSIEDVQEKGAEKNIWNEEERRDMRMENTA